MRPTRLHASGRLSGFALGVLCLLSITVVAIGVWATVAAGLWWERIEDPSSPAVHEPPRTALPTLQSNPHARFHTKPKPLAPDAVTHDWPSFLGPTHNAVSSETRLLKEWAKGGPTLVWEMRIGTGYTAPAIAGERLIFFHRLGQEEVVECLQAETGQRYWSYRYPSNYRDVFGYNNGPRASPVIDGERVYTLGAEGKLHCLTLGSGDLIWRRDLLSEFKVPPGPFGVGSTPLVEGELLIVNVGAPGGPCVAAFDKRTGRLVWKAGDQWGASYSSPVPAVVHGRRRVFAFVGGSRPMRAGGLLSIDPKTGKVDGRFLWHTTRSNQAVHASSPVVIGNQVFISASYQTGGALVNVLADGGHEKTWTNQNLGTHFNTAIHRDGYLYGFDGRNPPDASLVCLDVKTGNEMWRQFARWQEEIEQNGRKRVLTMSTFRGSLLWADGHFLCLGEAGHLLWLDLTPSGYRELARVWLFAAQETWAAPVLSRGLLYVCQRQRDNYHQTPPRLLCYDLRAPR